MHAELKCVPARTSKIVAVQKRSGGDILHCAKCNKFIARKGFYKHRKLCQGSDTSYPTPSNMSTFGIPIDDAAFEEMVNGIQNDEAGTMAKKDPTIRLVGQRLFQKDRAKPNKSFEVRKYVRNSMRMLARLYLYFKEMFPDASVLDMFDREHFGKLRKAVTTMTSKEDSEDGIKYGLKNNLFYLLMATATYAKGSYLEKRGGEQKADRDATVY